MKYLAILLVLILTSCSAYLIKEEKTYNPRVDCWNVKVSVENNTFYQLFSGHPITPYSYVENCIRGNVDSVMAWYKYKSELYIIKAKKANGD